MKEYTYVLGEIAEGSTLFALLDSSSTLSLQELIRKLGIKTPRSYGVLKSTDPALTLPESETTFQEEVNTLSSERFFTGDIHHFGFAHYVCVYVPEDAELIVGQMVQHLSSATLSESGFVFNQTE